MTRARAVGCELWGWWEERRWEGPGHQALGMLPAALCFAAGLGVRWRSADSRRAQETPAHRSREATIQGQKSNSSKQPRGQSEVLSWFPLMFQFQSLGPPNSGFSISLNVAEDRKPQGGGVSPETRRPWNVPSDHPLLQTNLYFISPTLGFCLDL